MDRGSAPGSVRGCACEFLPRFRTAPERAHTSDPLRLQEQRHTGARGFVWSTAKENDVSVSWNLLAAGGQVFGRDACGARDEVRGCRHSAAKVNDKQVLAGIQPIPQFLRCDSSYVQLPKEPAALHKLPADPQCEQGYHQHKQTRTHA